METPYPRRALIPDATGGPNRFPARNSPPRRCRVGCRYGAVTFRCNPGDGPGLRVPAPATVWLTDSPENPLSPDACQTFLVPEHVDVHPGGAESGNANLDASS